MQVNRVDSTIQSTYKTNMIHDSLRIISLYLFVVFQAFSFIWNFQKTHILAGFYFRIWEHVRLGVWMLLPQATAGSIWTPGYWCHPASSSTLAKLQKPIATVSPQIAWLVHRNPYNGPLKSPYNWVVLYPKQPVFFHQIGFWGFADSLDSIWGGGCRAVCRPRCPLMFSRWCV